MKTVFEANDATPSSEEAEELDAWTLEELDHAELDDGRRLDSREAENG